MRRFSAGAAESFPYTFPFPFSASGGLEEAQKKAVLYPLVKLVLTLGGTTYTYTKTRIWEVKHDEASWRLHLGFPDALHRVVSFTARKGGTK